MATTITRTSGGVFQALYRKAVFRVTVGINHDLARYYGDYLEAARLRAKYSWLRLAGPKGRLP